MLFKLLARYWFWWQLVSFQNSIEKAFQIDFSSFWHDLGFGGSLFLLNFNFKKYSKIVPAFGTILVLAAVFFCKKTAKKIQKGYLLQTQPYPRWTLYLEPSFCIRFGLFHLIRMRQDERRDMMCCVFMTFDICKFNSTKKRKIYKNDTSSKCSHTLGEPYT